MPQQCGGMEINMPHVSVIMPAYNAEKTVASSIESVLCQTYRDFELIIINDCASDATDDIIKEYANKDDRIVYVKNEKNSGVSYTRNRAVEMARGEWIAFLDSDDMWVSNKLSSQLALLEKYPDMQLSYTSSSFIDNDGVPYNHIMMAKEITTYSDILVGNLMSCSSVLIKSDIMRQVKMPGDQMHEDFYTWLTIMKNGIVAYGVTEPLLIYRLSQNSKSSSRIKSAKMLFNTYRAHGLGLIKSCYLMIKYTVYSVKKRKDIKGK